MTHHTDAERAEFEKLWAERPIYMGQDHQKELALHWWQAARRAPAVPVPQGWVAIPLEPTVEEWRQAQGTLLDANWDAVTCLAARIQTLISITRDKWSAAAPQPPEADHIPDAGKMDANVCNWMNAALSKDVVACPACGLSGLHACPSASTAESQGADAVKALEKVLRAVQRHLPPERIGERETIAEIISIVDPWPLGKPPVPWKDHMTAELVGKLTDVARQFHGTQQLRERIAGLLRPLCERIKQFDGDRMPEVDMGNPISVAAPVQLPEPDSYCFQHEETGLTEYVDAQQVEWGFEKNNPRWKRVGAAYSEHQVRQLLAAHGIKEQST